MAQGMTLVLATSSVLLTGCGAGTADGTYTVQVETAENGTTGIVVTPPETTPTEPTQPTEPAPTPHSLNLTSQPVNATVFEGQSQTFTLAYNSSHLATVSWYKNGSPIGNASGNSYTVTNATTDGAGTYSCSVTDGTLTVNCSNFTLTVNQIVRITQQPANLIMDEGNNGNFAVTATGTGPLSYQWYFNGQAISGATNAQISLNSLTMANEGNYHVVVRNAGSTATSTAVSLDVIAAVVQGDAMISWSRPTTRANGSALASTEIDGYEIYHSESAAGTMTKLTTVTAAELSLLVEDLNEGTHYFALTTVDKNKLVSAQSSRIAVNIQ